LAYGIGFNVGSGQWFLIKKPVSGYKTLSPNASDKNYTKADMTLFWDVWDRLSQNFIKKDAIDTQKMIYGAISGMVSSLGDPYTVFLTPQQNKETKEELGGSFEGIGAQLGLKDNKIVVIAPLSGTPAEKAGILPGDWILEIDGKSTENLSLPEAVSKIRGPKGTKVVLSILREKEEKPKDLAIVRDTITVKSVEWQSLDKKLGNIEALKIQNARNMAYLKLSRFGDGTDTEWDSAIADIKLEMASDTIYGLILDLRNNPGGYLTGSVYIAGEFLPKGNVVVVQENAHGAKQSYYVDRDGQLLDIPMVVLINKGSASASEIVSGALRDWERAKLIGEKTFGKGSIQEAQDLSQGAGLHITTAKWLLPKGAWINGTGIEPDIKVEPDEKQPEKDVQLEKAAEELSKLF
jgi:carboxyl-terminal processing protease